MYLKGKHQAQLIYQLRLKSKEIGDGKGPRTSTKGAQTVKVWAKRLADLITWEKEQKCWISCPLQDHLYSRVFCCYHLVGLLCLRWISWLWWPNFIFMRIWVFWNLVLKPIKNVMNRNQQHICVTSHGCDNSSGECSNSDQTKQRLNTIQVLAVL